MLVFTFVRLSTACVSRLDIAPNVARCADTSEIVLSSRVIAFEATVTADAIVAADSLVDARADMWPSVLLTLPNEVEIVWLSFTPTWKATVDLPTEAPADPSRIFLPFH